MEIRECEAKDIKDIYALICELEETNFNYEQFENSFNNKLNSDRGYYIVGTEKNKIIGFLSLNIDYQLHHAAKVATIEELIVTSQNRSNGLGRILLENAIEYAKSKSCETIELTSNFSRERAHHFYEKNGFEKGSIKFKMNLNKQQ